MSSRLLVYGASGHGKVVADAAVSAGWDVIGFADDDPSKLGTTVLGIPVTVIGPENAILFCRERPASFVVAVGTNATRKRLFLRLVEAGLTAAAVRHPSAQVAAGVVLGTGSVVFAGVIINPDARVGDNAIVNTGVIVEHDCVIGAHAHLSPGVRLGGSVTVGEGVHLGVGVAVRNNIEIGSWSVIGVGAAVVTGIPDRVVAFGVPARVQRKVGE